jgi:hypothetical protein
MRSVFVFLFFALIVSRALGQGKESNIATPDPTKKIQIVEAACGKCQLGLSGKSCDLAVRINGKAYYVDGTNIDSHGDAHGKHGFCNAISKAEVQGEIINDRFQLSYFKLIPGPVNKADKTKMKNHKSVR